MRTRALARYFRYFRRALLVLLAAWCFRFAIGADDPAIGKGGAGHTIFRKAPERARRRSNPLAGDPDAVLAGKKLFQEHCAQCHGDAAKGGPKAPSLHLAEVANATDGEIFWLLTNGVIRRGMPDWSKLPEPERWQLTAYIKSLSAAPRTPVTAREGPAREAVPNGP